MEAYALLLAATLNAGTVLALAALGLLINEKAGIVNLGAEGMMLCAAIAGFAAVAHTGQDSLGFLAGMAAGGVLAALFGVLVIWLNTNQYATGLALSLLAQGFLPSSACPMSRRNCQSGWSTKFRAWQICPSLALRFSASIPWFFWPWV